MRHLFVLFLLIGTAARAAECPASTPQHLELPHVRQALAQNLEVVVVAIGSSTTQGWRSSDKAHSYPAVLQAALNRALPHAHVAVINRGIGGQDAAEEIMRLKPDVLAIRPQLVIWQVGANGALHHTDPEVFRDMVIDGLRLLHSAEADVILMDNQRAPSILRSGDDTALDSVLAELAQAGEASLFSRGILMDEWRQEGAPYELFLSADGLHHNDLGYHCMAQALADSIVVGLGDKPVASTPGLTRTN